MLRRSQPSVLKGGRILNYTVPAPPGTLQVAPASACWPGAGPAPNMHREKPTIRAPRRDTSARGELSHAVFALREVRRISRALPGSLGRQARQKTPGQGRLASRADRFWARSGRG